MMKKKTIAILGAGITGLATAYYLSKNYKVIVLEKSNDIGGMSYSFEHKGFTLDYGPHKIYTQLPGILDEIKKVIPLRRIKKKNKIYLKGNYFNFPLSIKEIALKMPFTAFSGVMDIIKNKLGKKSGSYLENRFGSTLYNLVFKNYAEKIWDAPEKLDVELAKRRVSMSSFFDLVKSILFKDSKKISADYFYYPNNGMKQLIDALREKIEKDDGKILTNADIKEMLSDEHGIKEIRIKNETIKPDFVISTIPLSDLACLLNQENDSVKSLCYRDVNMIYFLINKKKILKDNWIFFPEKEFLFHRISEQKSFSPDTAPESKSVLIAETTKQASKENLDKIKRQLIKLGIFRESEIEEIFVKTLIKAYPLYYKGFKEELNKTISGLEKFDNLLTIGRHGLFNYNNMDHCWDMAKKTAEYIEKGSDKKEWKNIMKVFDNYKIVD